MKIEHNSHSLFYREPFGAKPAGEKVRLRLGISDAGIPNAVRMVYHTTSGEEETKNMPYVLELGDFCFYEITLTLPKEPCVLWYYFEVSTHMGSVYYGNNEEMLGGLGAESYRPPEKMFQVTVYDPAYQTPEWFRHAVCYQIFPDRFFNGNEDGSFLGNRQDIIKRNWNDIPYYLPEQFGGTYKANDFFGGNLFGIQKKLPYLAELGISAIYLNPVFRAYSNHKYDTGDYLKIDESFGTEEDFRELCQQAEEYGIHIILDGVFNHTGSDSRYFNKNGTYDSLGAYQSTDSPYSSWYHFSHFPDQYDSWWGMLNLPQIRKDSEEHQNFVAGEGDSVVRHWIREGASGWRLDVVDELCGKFVKKIRHAIKEENPDSVLIGEVWEDASHKESYGEFREYFWGNELDSVMNYPLRNAITAAVLGNITAAQFDARLTSLRENYPKPAFYALLNLLSSHDVERILTVMSGAPDYRSVSRENQANYHVEGELLRLAVERTKQAVMLQMLLPGVPCVYYGDEAGMQGYADPFCRAAYPWDAENQELFLWYKQAIALRKRFAAYTDGELETVYKIGNGYAFIRYQGEEKHVVAANFSDRTEWFRLDLARFGAHSIENELYEEYYQSEDGIYYIEMPPRGIKVFSAYAF